MFLRSLPVFGLLAVLSCVSCVPSGPRYVQGPPNLLQSAMFLPSKREGNFFNNTTFILGEIDGLVRGRPVVFANGEKGIAVTPGPHRVLVGVIHGSSEFQNGMLSADVEIPVSVKAGTVYEPAGTVSGRDRVDLWIQERGTGKKMSKVVSVGPKNHKPYVPPVMIPVAQ